MSRKTRCLIFMSWRRWVTLCTACVNTVTTTCTVASWREAQLFWMKKFSLKWRDVRVETGCFVRRHRGERIMNLLEHPEAKRVPPQKIFRCLLLIFTQNFSTFDFYEKPARQYRVVLIVIVFPKAVEKNCCFVRRHRGERVMNSLEHPGASIHSDACMIWRVCSHQFVIIFEFPASKAIRFFIPSRSVCWHPEFSFCSSGVACCLLFFRVR